MHKDALKKVLGGEERKVFSKLKTPQKIQNFLDSLPMNFEVGGETYQSPRRVLKSRKAHCLEGAVLAAAALAYHGHTPLLMDLRTMPGKKDDDHVVTLFKQNGYWGALSKTNHGVLRYRDPIYKNPRELALSYYHEYFLNSGKKTLASYSAPFDLSRFAPGKWVIAEEDLDWLVDKLDKSRHFPIVPKKNKRLIRDASLVEIRAGKVVEWKPPKKHR